MDISELKKVLDYDAETGTFRWKVSIKGNAFPGKIAGTRHCCGYVAISFKNKSYLAHRLAIAFSGFLLEKGKQVDHVNGDRSDNRLSNLRVASHAQNCHNSKIRKDSGSGYKGVGFDKRRGLWRARIRIDNREIWLGYFKKAEDAHAAYRAASTKLHGDFGKS